MTTRARQIANVQQTARTRVRQRNFDEIFILSTEDDEPILTEDDQFLEEYSNAGTPSNN